MAFRKTYRSNYFPSPLVSGFGEPRFRQVAVSDSSIEVDHVFDTVDDINKTVLPMISLSTVISSGQRISGSVDFAPNDPAHIDSMVHGAVSNFISTHTSNSENSESHES